MNKLGIVLGLVLVLVAGVLFISNFQLTKTIGWSDVSQEPAIITPEAGFAYITLDMEAGQNLKVTATPTESGDSFLLLLMTSEKFTQYLTGMVTPSEVLVWQEPASTGQQLSLEYRISTSGEYAIVLHPRRDDGTSQWQDGIPFNIETQISTSLNLTLPAVALLVLGIVIIAFSFIRGGKKQAQMPTPPPPPA
ncbi:MAG: hypothetical protein QXF52_07495 [Thermoproteota archaeon]